KKMEDMGWTTAAFGFHHFALTQTDSQADVLSLCNTIKQQHHHCEQRLAVWLFMKKTVWRVPIANTKVFNLQWTTPSSVAFSASKGTHSSLCRNRHESVRLKIISKEVNFYKCCSCPSPVPSAPFTCCYLRYLS
ncbi:hypothetical protein GOODEAATRI_032987, partial [Goodea atripinnis]